MNQAKSKNNNQYKSDLFASMKMAGIGTLGLLSIALSGVSIFLVILLLWGKENLTGINTTLFILFTLVFQFSLSLLKGTKYGNSITKESRLILKRLFDVIISSIIFIVILSWLMPLLALIILFDSKGPIIYKYYRLGIGGHPIILYKFKTLKIENNDYTITRFGKLLRQTGLDNLPMWYNVLIGEVSLVGTHLHKFGERDKILKNYKEISEFKPGLTSLCRISNIFSSEDILKIDLEYIHNWSLLLDLKILYKTFVMFIRYKNY